MRSEASSQEQNATGRFFLACLHALIRAETDGRVPVRFSGVGREVWRTFRNELTAADLVALSIEDAGVTMPIPFNPSHWWPDWPTLTHLAVSDQDAERWIIEALSKADQPRDTYLRNQAFLLDINLPAAQAVQKLPAPASHERWLELPGTGGWLAYALSTRPESELYFWENFYIVCGNPQEMLLAGLIAWELGAPPRTDLPIVLDDPVLTVTLKAGETYDGIIGRRDWHVHRDLRILHREGKKPAWV